MNKIGAAEIIMPSIQPSELWQESDDGITMVQSF